MTRTSRAAALVIAVLFALLWSGTSGADVLTAEIAVQVAGETGASAVVELADAGAASPRGTATIPTRSRRTFHGVAPGRYIITVTMGAERAQASVEVSGGDAVVIDVKPAPSSPPRLTVIFRTRPAEASEYRPEDLAGLPAGTNLNALLDTAAPFVIADRIDNGGLTTGDWARVGSRGSSWTATRVFVGDEELDAPNARGLFPFYADLSGMQAVAVSSGLADPLIGTPGAVIALTPLRPGRRPHGVIGGAFTGSGMVSGAPSAPAPTIGTVNQWHDAMFRWDGPITSKLGAVVSAFTSGVDESRRGLSVPTALVSSFETHFVAAPNDRDEVRLFGSAQSVRRPFDALPVASLVEERDRFLGAQLAWDHHAPGGAWRSLSVTFRHAAFSPDATASTGVTIDRATDGPVPTTISDDALRAIGARFVVAPSDRRTGALDHSLHLAVDVHNTQRAATVSGAPMFGERAAGIPARIWVASAPGAGSTRTTTSAVLALGDDIAVSRRLTLSLGLRGDVSSGAAAGAAGRIRWRTASPLVALHWTPQWLVMTAGYRRYVRQISTDLLAFGDPGEPVVGVYRWTDANGDGVAGADERGVLVARAGRGPSVASIDAGLHPSYTDEFSARVERRLGASHYLRVTATVRREYDLLRSVDTGAPLAAYVPISVPNQIEDPKRARDGLLTVYDRLPESFGQDQYVLSNAPGEGARYRGLEIAWEMRSEHWRSTAGASAYESSGIAGNRGFRVDENDPGVVGEQLENPNAASVADSRGFFDRGYVLKWSTVYRAPHGVTAAVTARYQDGQPFPRLVLVPGLAQGPEVVASDYSVATRFSFTGTIDARLAKAFSIKGRTLTATLDVFNLSNLADEVEENAVSGAAFRASTAMQPPRTVRVGVRVQF